MCEWLAVSSFGVALVAMAVFLHLTDTVDHVVYDSCLPLSTQGAFPDITVVEIDDASIAKLGRWPWPRSVHARFVDTLATARPAAIVYDVLFTEASPDDGVLARAFTSVPTFLPILLTPFDLAGHREARLPVSPLVDTAAGVGHINFEVDPDGVVRSVALFEGDSRSRWPQLMVPVSHAAREGKLHLAGEGQSIRGAPDVMHADREKSEARILIPFIASGKYRNVSFSRVLSGQVPPEWIRKHIVVVGATASGLYDRYSTPLARTLGPMPGVYLHANVLNALLTGTAIEPVSISVELAVSLWWLALLLAGLWLFSPLGLLSLTAALVGLSIFAAAGALLGMHLWIPPGPTVVGLAAVYLGWSWRRLEMTMAYLRHQLLQLAEEPYLLPEAPAPDAYGERAGDLLEKQMALMAQATRRVSDMKRFVWDSLESVPGPVLVSDLKGVVLIVNHAAKAYFRQLTGKNIEGQCIRETLAKFTFVKLVGASAGARSNAREQWPALLDIEDSEHASWMATGIEVRDSAGRNHLLRYVRCVNSKGQTTGWIANLVDVTALHDAERQREDALRLLSHDMRSPQASILALVEMERAKADSEHLRDLMNRIERYARRALTLADDFVQLARAESATYLLERLELSEILLDAIDEVWPQAHAKSIGIDAQLGDCEDSEVHADRSLMTRVFVNVLGNAVKYSPANTSIVCQVRCAGETHSAAFVSCTIRDQGYGIPAEQQAHLFERFRRFHDGVKSEIQGAGLGMAFVKTVVTRHGGFVTVESRCGSDSGTAFTIQLPRRAELDQAAMLAAGSPHEEK
jgi:CHASE2 domain-containing sensor protein/signal transduction histidine kinase